MPLVALPAGGCIREASGAGRREGGQSAVKLRDQFASQRPHLVCKHGAGAAASLLLLPPQQRFAPAVKGWK